MKTKLVYILTSSDKDIFLEQAYVSMFSARQYMPDVHIVLLTDTITYQNIKNDSYRCRLSEYVNEFIPRELSSDYNNTERSRWLKTNMRSLVEGRFLFVDTDTVICGNLSEVDEWNCNIGAVWDFHVPFSLHPLLDYKKRLLKKMYGLDMPTDINYYNSGVMFVNDTEETHRFFDMWHTNWEKARHVENGYRDQQSLIKTEYDLSQFITPISGNYNCQVLCSIQYLYTAKIVHFFNSKYSRDILSPFFEKKFYMDIKEKQCLDKEHMEMVVNCKTMFVSPTFLIGKNELVIRSSYVYKVFYAICRHKYLFRFFNFLSKHIIKFFK